jgi:hypothetical protein
MFDKEKLITFITEVSNDFTDDYLTTSELQQKFINQVVDYANGCCETESEIHCFIDGLLINLY